MGVALLSVPQRIRTSDDAEYMLIGELCERFRCSRMWIERKLRDPLLPFPQSVRFGAKTSARRWRRADVLAWEIERAKISEGRKS
jgi:predicted DNA-binding transcriptional regulator AlpA